MASRDGGRRPLHPRLSAAERRRLLLEGVELYGRGAFFACHESFEEIWRSTRPEPRDLFQGLVQLAAGLHHFHRHGRAASAARLLARARRRLEPLGPVACGLDLATLLAGVGRWQDWLAAPEGPAPEPPRLSVVDPAAVG